jgi:serine/threonine protein kinase
MNIYIVKHFTPLSTESEVLKKAKELFDREAKILNRLGKHPQILTLLAHIHPRKSRFFYSSRIYRTHIRHPKLPQREITETKNTREHKKKHMQ